MKSFPLVKRTFFTFVISLFRKWKCFRAAIKPLGVKVSTNLALGLIVRESLKLINYVCKQRSLELRITSGPVRN